MHYLTAFSPSGIDAFRIEEVIEAGDIIEAEQKTISLLNEQDSQDYWEGRAQLKMYVLGNQFQEEHDVITGKDISIAHDESAQEALSKMDTPEDGFPRGSDADRL